MAGEVNNSEAGVDDPLDNEVERERTLRRDQQADAGKKAGKPAKPKTVSVAGANVRLDGGVFYGLLLLSAVKDASDFFTLGTGGTFINIATVMAYAMIIISQPVAARRLIFKRNVGPAILEFIPFVSGLPLYTISIIYMKIKMDAQASSSAYDEESAGQEDLSEKD